MTSSNITTTTAATAADNTTNTILWDEREISTLSDGQEIALSLVSVISGTLSVMGSSLIIWHCYQSRKYRQAKASINTPYGRLMLALSLSDIISSTAFIMSPFFLPQETSQRVWAIGNDISCSFLGFWTQLANLAYFYNGLLGLYYFLTIRMGVTRQTFAKRIEPYLHVVSMIFFLGSATAGATAKLKLVRGAGLANSQLDARQEVIASVIISDGCLVPYPIYLY